MATVSVTINGATAESIGHRMDEDADVPKQNGDQDGSKMSPEARSEKAGESRPEVIKTTTTTTISCESVGFDVKDGTNGRSQYHSIQRLLSPSGGSGSQQSPVGGAVNGSQQSTSGGAAVRCPTSGGSSASLMSGMIAAGIFAEKDPAEKSMARPMEFLRDAMQQQEKLQKVEDMLSRVEGQRSTRQMTRKDWIDCADDVKNETGPQRVAERSVEVSTNDFMDSIEDNDSSMKSPLTDLSNSSSEDEEEDLSDEEEEILLNRNRRQRFQDDEEEEEEDMDVEDLRKSRCPGGGDTEVTSYLEDGVSGYSDSGSYGDSVEAKRARMESIVTNMKRSPSSTSNEITQPERLRVVDPRRPKRKQYIPKQHDACRSTQVVEAETAVATKKIGTTEKEELQHELCRMEERLADIRVKYFQVFGDATLKRRNGDDDDDEEEEEETNEAELGRRDARKGNRVFVNGCRCPEQTSPLGANTAIELKHLAGLLKAEISNTVGTLVDEIVTNFLNRNRGQPKDSGETSEWGGPDSTAKFTEKTSSVDDATHQDKASGEPKNESDSPLQSDTKPPSLLTPAFFPQNSVRSSPPSATPLVLPQPVRPMTTDSLLVDFSKIGASGFSTLYPYSAPSKPMKSSKLTDKFMAPLFESHHVQRSPMPAIFPHPFFHHPPVMAAAAAAAVAAGMFAKEPEQTEALPLIVNTPTKKKRTKVTDTRLSPRAARAILQENGQTNQRQQPYPGLLGGHPASAQHHPASTQVSTDRPNSDDPDQDLFFAPFRPQHHHHQQSHSHPHVPHHHHHHHPLLPVTLPTSVAIPNPSLRHSDIMQAIYGTRKHHQHRFELDLSTASTSTLCTTSQQRFVSSDLERPRALPGQARSASSSPEMAQTSSDDFSGSMITKADSMDNYDSSIYGDQTMTTTLTPMHLRKAKLMFFYVRYPSSAILKIYFPDVKFNKNNTAQLIKWFSNFREFYYIQMEKYARQALAEGVKNASDLVVSSDAELYRVLILHYNRNNRIEVPSNFRQTVQATLREFFRSIQSEKDQEPSWKKAIYKVIAHLDDTVPEYFKSANWMEQLADG